MPSIAHEAPLELLRGDPQLASVLLAGLGVVVPVGAKATLAPADVSASLPAELRADAVVLLAGAGNDQLAVVVEVQLRYDAAKSYAWPAYLTQVRAAHRCPAVLLVICPAAATAARCRVPIATGHPGFDLMPLVIDSATTPSPGAGTGSAAPELAVLAVLTGALDLSQESARQLILANLATLDDARLTIYTVLVLNAVAGPARQAMEAMMTTARFRNDFVDRILAEGEAKGLAEGEAKGLAEGEAKGLAEGEAKGKAEGEARMILRVLSARGLDVSGDARERVMACSDLRQLEIWGDRAATAANIEDVFG